MDETQVALAKGYDAVLPNSFVLQVIGIILLIFICVGLIVYVIRESCHQDEEMQEADVAELTVLRMSSLRTRTS